MDDTRDESYARRLTTISGARWKRVLDVQRPYRWNLRRQELGRTLDVGCGIGRNLATLGPGSVGVDHNEASIAEARARGLDALTTEEWETSAERVPASFDSLLLAHVIEHMDEADGRALLESYLPYVKPGGRVFFVCPQEKGYTTDATHVRFTDGEDLSRLARDVGLEPEAWFSFPVPRVAGRWFPYNEFCLRARVPSA